jgi:hypothetical protein
MPICECGFNFAKAHLKKQRIESYAAVRNRDWLKLMRKERAILSERDSDKRLSMICAAGDWVGNLMRCPKCGNWMLLKPQQGKASPVVLLKAVPFTQRGRSTGRRGRASVRNRKPLARRLTQSVKDPAHMYDPDERAELLKQYEDLLPKLKSPEVRARMIADGRDPEAVLKRLTGLKDTLLASEV